MKQLLVFLMVLLIFLSGCKAEQSSISPGESRPEIQSEEPIRISKPESSQDSPRLEEESAVSAEPPMVFDGETVFTYSEKHTTTYMDPTNSFLKDRFSPLLAISNENVYVLLDSKKIFIQEDDEMKELDLYDFVIGNLSPLEYEMDRYQFTFPGTQWFYQSDTKLYLFFQVGGEADYVATHGVCINLETKEFEEFFLDAPGIYILDISLENNNIYIYGKTFLEPLYVYVIDTENIKLFYENTYEFDGDVTGAEANGSTARVILDNGRSPDETVTVEFER